MSGPLLCHNDTQCWPRFGDICMSATYGAKGVRDMHGRYRIPLVQQQGLDGPQQWHVWVFDNHKQFSSYFSNTWNDFVYCKQIGHVLLAKFEKLAFDINKFCGGS